MSERTGPIGHTDAINTSENGDLLRLAVSKRYGGFSLKCEATFGNVVTAVFGPSGSGKTTLLNCIAGLTSPDEGEIRFDGRAYFSSGNGVNVPPNRRRFGYVFQDPALFPHMSVARNIAYGHNLTPPALRSIDVDHAVEILRVSHLLDRRPASLSGGERQRVALARALATSPDLLLLDEPLASLDGAMRGAVIEYLRRIRQELGTPMVYVSHSLSEVMALADETLALVDGRTKAFGRTSQVLVHPDVRRIADYATLENLLEAEVTATPGDALAELRIGNVRVLTPEVGQKVGETVLVAIRAGDVIIALDQPKRISARNAVPARIDEIHVLGPRVLVYADIGVRMVVEITPAALKELDLREGATVYLLIKSNSIMVVNAADL